MKVVFGIVYSIVVQVMAKPALVMAILAFIGLKLNKEDSETVLSGVLKAASGMLILGFGSTLVSNSITSLQNILNAAIGTTGYVPSAMLLYYALRHASELGMFTILTFALGWVLHLIMLKVFPKRCKVLYTSCNQMLVINAMIMLFLYFGFGLRGGVLFVVGTVCNCLWLTFVPMISYKATMEISEGAFALAHSNSLSSWLSYKLGKFVGNPEKDDSENIKLPGILSAFGNPDLVLILGCMLLYVVITVVGYCLPQSREAVLAAAGTDNWVLWAFVQGLSFSASISVALYGVKMFLEVLVAAMTGISDKLLPGVTAGLDCAAVWPISPVACTIGFFGAAAGALICMVLMLVFKAPAVIIPQLAYCFFDGATAGVFGNRTGGWKGALLGGLIVGIMTSVGGLLMLPLLGQAALDTGMVFANTDTNFLGTILFGAVHLIKSLFVH